jgi:hypothetical protein
MNQILTSNQLSRIYGESPIANRKPTSDLQRGYLIYIELTEKGIYARVFFKNFPDPTNPDNQSNFEDEVIAKAVAGTIGDVSTGKEFPEVYQNHVNRIDFGWTPGHVSYILNSPVAKFLEPNPAEPLVQPIIFREDKVVIDRHNVPSISNYIKNHSFYNLQYISKSGAGYSCSILRFDNLMLINEIGDPLGKKPADSTLADKRKFEYCMDIPILIDSAKLSSAMSGDQIEAGALRMAGSLGDAIAIVFDPPQGNGGGGGVPDYP